MILTIRLFGPFAAAVGERSVTLDLPDRFGISVSEIFFLLGEQYPAITDMLKQSFMAVNGKFANTNSIVTVKDELAVIGLVSGG